MKKGIAMSTKAFEVGDQVRVVESGPGRNSGITGVVRSVDKSRRRTEPYYIYYVEIPGEETLIDFEYRELELVMPA
jgi:transcription antitermination factor NusG